MRTKSVVGESIVGQKNNKPTTFLAREILAGVFHCLREVNMKYIYLLPFVALALSGHCNAQSQCPSEATLIIQSVGYSGPIEIEARRRPASRVTGEEQ